VKKSYVEWEINDDSEGEPEPHPDDADTAKACNYAAPRAPPASRFAVFSTDQSLDKEGLFNVLMTKRVADLTPLYEKAQARKDCIDWYGYDANAAARARVTRVFKDEEEDDYNDALRENAHEALRARGSTGETHARKAMCRMIVVYLVWTYAGVRLRGPGARVKKSHVDWEFSNAAARGGAKASFVPVQVALALVTVCAAVVGAP
jgi:hypothetical protein